MAHSLVWKDLSQFQIDSYCNLASREDCYSFLSEKFDLGTDDKSAILKDLYFYSLEFAKTNKFTPSQMSAYFSIIKETHRVVSANPKIMLERDYAYFKNLVLTHSIQRPPFSEKIFKYKTMMLLLEYTTNTYFRHYLMYKYAFSKKMRMELVIENFMPSNLVAETSAVLSQTADQQIGTESTKAKSESDERSAKSTPEDSSSLPTTQTSPQDFAAQTQSIKEESVAFDSNTPASPPQAQGDSPIIALDDSKIAAAPQSPQLPPKSMKHEAAIVELKTFISSVLSSKLDEIKSSVASKIQGSDDSKKDSKAKVGKK